MLERSTHRKLINGAGWMVTALLVAAVAHALVTSPEIAAPPETATGPARDYAMFITWDLPDGKVVTGSRFASVEDQAERRPSAEWCYFEKMSGTPVKQSFYMTKDMYGDAEFTEAEIESLQKMGAEPNDVGFWLAHCEWLDHAPKDNASAIPATDPEVAEAARRAAMAAEEATRRGTALEP